MVGELKLSENHQKTILILSTGGTIEKTYDEYDGSLTNRETVIQEKILDRLRYPWLRFVVKAIMSKDSLDMDLEDRKIIYEAIRRFEEMNSPMVVLHGTDTMDQTLKLCFELSEKNPVSVPIIFTGAMRPLGFENSDARQNVTEAIYGAQNLAAGFYLSFHGQVYNSSNFRKNKKLRTFEFDKL